MCFVYCAGSQVFKTDISESTTFPWRFFLALRGAQSLSGFGCDGGGPKKSKVKVRNSRNDDAIHLESMTRPCQ